MNSKYGYACYVAVGMSGILVRIGCGALTGHVGITQQLELK